VAQDPVPSRRAVLWRAALAAAVVAVAPPALAAQKLDHSDLPVPMSSVRQRQLEPRAGAGDRVVEVWRAEAPPEMLFGWYLRKLIQRSPVRDGTLDTSDVVPGQTTMASYHLTFHAFGDECLDPVSIAPAASDSASCKRWRRGEVKRQILKNARVGYEPGAFLERYTFTWLSRDAKGELVSHRIEVRDAGLSDDWKRYDLVALITLERVVLERGTQ
jgi:hypothetical protein